MSNVSASLHAEVVLRAEKVAGVESSKPWQTRLTLIASCFNSF
jgi:hypothetical protein